MSKKKYVEVNDLLKHLQDEQYKGAIRRVLLQAPAADVVEVVRCKDCKYYDSYYLSCDHDRHDHQEFRVVQEPDDYCSYAERRSK